MRRCEIDKIGVDLPCLYKAPHFLKILSKGIGDRRKTKIWLCDKHYEIISDNEYLTNLFDERDKEESIEESEKWRAHLSK